MTTQVTLNSDGTTTSSQAGYASSTDYQDKGIVARSGMGTRTVADHTRLDENELIVIDGMELKVSQARDVGLIGAHVPDAGLSVGNAVPSEPKAAPSTGHDGLDITIADLNSKIDAGQMEAAEAMTYETTVAEIALAGLTVAQISDTIDGLADGSVDPMDLDQNQRDIIRNTESKITEAATKSAMAELGPENFQRLSKIAAVSPEVNQAIRQYAGMRAVGRGDVTWAEFMQDVDDHVAGYR